LTTVSLATAREMAAECRRKRLAAIDPIEHRQTDRREAQLAAARSMTFDQCRDAFIEAHRAAWRNAKHRGQWTASLATYVTPVLGPLPIQSVDVGLVMKALEPIWSTKPETAARVRGERGRVTISKRFCQMMGGDITVAREPGKGSTFTIRLPRIVGGF
jgi:hypothetical protein